MTGGARIAPVADDDHLPAAALWVDWGFAFDDVRCDTGLLTRPAGAQFKAPAGRVAVSRKEGVGTAVDSGARVGNPGAQEAP
ncbi:hypothetical protein GCM10010330_64740 [Streptomyces tendae]|uniref:hypothetical protein n=1 Tax=Streptomyces tendae TaxID=1932 RepID=UPI00167A4030|nr:hypothetical protein [Streptomyces tendae]GHB01563.1 hypothetical protein GCM10010330_64740 [Streptomyces tendae]